MKKFLSTFFILILLSLPIVISAQSDVVDVTVPDVVGLTRDEAINIISEAGLECFPETENFVGLAINDVVHLLENTTLRIATCCDSRPQFAYREYSPMHLSDETGKCAAVLYFSKEKYCANCGAIWEPAVVVSQTSGCGSYHL